MMFQLSEILSNADHEIIEINMEEWMKIGTLWNRIVLDGCLGNIFEFDKFIEWF